ncbi:MAG: DNA repair protein RecN [Clostridiales bacterium]|nr:DNA repair protein RecN [Clostridiales bacterium]
MISEINIKNIAIIEESSVVFDKGLNILTGETGAGKSIIIDSINFVLGQRTSKEIIRQGAEEASVSALMYVENEENRSKLKSMGIDIEDDGGLLLTRSLNISGRNLCRINGKAAPLSMLRSAAELLIDIYGQHQNQNLLDAKKHMGLLDRFCGDELKSLLKENEEKYTLYRKSVKRLKELNGLGKDRETALEILSFQINEIKEAKIKPGEEDELRERQAFLFNAARIKELSNSAVNSLYRGEGSAYEKIGSALNSLISLSKMDESVKDSIADLEDISDRLESLTEVIRDINERAEGSGSELEEVDERLEKIKAITAKYGGNEEECIKFLAEAEEKYNTLVESEERAAELGEEIKRQKRDILHTCIKISDVRKKYAAKIEKEIEDNLHRLGMERACFKINIERRKSFDKLGMDEVEFFISTNGEEGLKPLVKIASGGEMSRVMLSIKAVLSACDDMETFIFDEIDTGISGITAQQVAVKMAELGKSRQILCITHLSQICAAGDVNFCIEKKFGENGTRTEVRRLGEDDVIKEIARLNGGRVITEATLKAAKDLRAVSRNF